MAKKKDPEPLKDLQEDMQQLQKLREQRAARSAKAPVSGDAVEPLKAAITPVVEAFVKGDKALLLQYSDSTSFHVSYGYHTGFSLSLDAPNQQQVSVYLQTDSGAKSLVYSGEMDKEAVQLAVKSALMEWYKSVF